MSVKLVVGILLLVSVLLAGPAQAVGLESSMTYTPISTDSQIVVDIPALTAQTTATEVVTDGRERDLEEF